MDKGLKNLFIQLRD